MILVSKEKTQHHSEDFDINLRFGSARFGSIRSIRGLHFTISSLPENQISNCHQMTKHFSGHHSVIPSPITFISEVPECYDAILGTRLSPTSSESISLSLSPSERTGIRAKKSILEGLRIGLLSALQRQFRRAASSACLGITFFSTFFCYFFMHRTIVLIFLEFSATKHA